MEAVDAILGEPTSLWDGGERNPLDDHVARGGRDVRSQRHLLLPVLHSLQDRVGWVSRGAMTISVMTRVTSGRLLTITSATG